MFQFLRGILHCQEQTEALAHPTLGRIYYVSNRSFRSCIGVPLVCGKTILARCIVQDAHIKMGHGHDTLQILSTIQAEFYIPGVRKLILCIKKSCPGPWLYQTQQNHFHRCGRRHAGHSQVYSSAIQLLPDRFIWPNLCLQQPDPNQTMCSSGSLPVQHCSTPGDTAQLLPPEHLKWVLENLCSKSNFMYNLDQCRSKYCEIWQRSHAIRSQGYI